MKKTPDDKILDRIVETQALLNRYEPASVENLTEALQGVVDAIARKLPKATGTNRQKLQTLYKQARFELNKLKAPFIRDLSGDMENTGKIAYDATAKGFSEGLDLQALTFDQLPTSAIAMWTDLNADVSMWAYDEKRLFKPMKEITKAFAGHEKAFRAAITQSLAEGLGTKATQRRFKELAQSNIKNAGIRAIARTAIAESMTRARNYCEDTNFYDVIQGYQWVSVLDSRTTIICASQAGLIHKKRSDFLYGEPPLHFGCVLPDTNVSTSSNINAISKRPFNGKVVTIRTLGNNVLSVTPNHPVLTDRGFVQAKFLKKGDNLVSGLAGHTFVPCGDNNQVETRIEDAFDSLVASGKMVPCPMPNSPEDFHGDGIIENEVTIILIDRELPDEVITSIAHNFVKSFLKITGSDALPFEFSGSGFSDFVCGLFSSGCGNICGDSQSFDLLRSRIIHSGLLLLRSVPRFKSSIGDHFSNQADRESDYLDNTIQPDPIFEQLQNICHRGCIVPSVTTSGEIGISDNGGDGLLIDTEFSADFVKIEPLMVKFDAILSCCVSDFSGHVYNLSCDDNLYSANNIITHNCRSIIVPLTDFSDRENIRQRTRTWDEVQSIDRDKQKYTKFVLASDEVKNIKLPDQRTKFNAFDVWFRQLPQDRQVQWLGPQKYKIYKTGNLGMKQLVDGAGKIRTVKELAKLAGIDAEQLKEIRRKTIPAYQPRVTKFRAAAERE